MSSPAVEGIERILDFGFAILDWSEPTTRTQPESEAGLQKETKRTKAEEIGDRGLYLFGAAFQAAESFVSSFPLFAYAEFRISLLL